MRSLRDIRDCTDGRGCEADGLDEVESSRGAHTRAANAGTVVAARMFARSLLDDTNATSCGSSIAIAHGGFVLVLARSSPARSGSHVHVRRRNRAENESPVGAAQKWETSTMACAKARGAS
jgi:hypothetical protein